MTQRLDADELRKTDLPYGMWTCADGREVLYNRYYKPIWERRGGPATFANPTEWVADITAHRWFYNDGTPRGCAIIRAT